MFGRKHRPERPAERHPRRGRRRGAGLYLLALIGLAAIVFVLIRFLIIPFLVMIG